MLGPHHGFFCTEVATSVNWAYAVYLQVWQRGFSENGLGDVAFTHGDQVGLTSRSPSLSWSWAMGGKRLSRQDAGC